MGRHEVIVLDTHVVIWWMTGQTSKLTASTVQIIRNELADGKAIASSITAWEIAMLVGKGKLELSMDVMTWLDAASELEGFRFLPVDNLIAVKSNALPGDFHGDPADRIIVALTRELAATLVTADGRIAGYPHVVSIR